MEAVDVLHAVERLVAIAHSEPGADPGALKEVTAILSRMGLNDGSPGYKAEKLAAVCNGFGKWLGGGKEMAQEEDSNISREHLLSDIEKLRKVLARGSGGQD
ncbi:MAG: hypothetical protein ABIQ86_13800 [Steroidobacteraceae bacterium]